MTSRNLLCDWFACYQDFNQEIPKLTDGIVCSISRDMEKLEWRTDKSFQHGGSYSTSIWVKSDGHRLSLSGNVGRFGRPDNVFGYTIDECKQLANRIVTSLELPEFTHGEIIETHRMTKKGEIETVVDNTGAKVTSVHLTENMAAGNETDGKNFLYWLESQKPGRADVTGYYGQTVYIGENSKYARRNVYDKGEAIAHETKKLKRKKQLMPKHYRYLQQLEKWCRTVGLVRHEVEFKSRYLTQNGLRFWGDCTQENAVKHYEKYRAEIMNRCESFTELADLPAVARGIYHSYLAGEDMRDLPKSTLYRYRKMLKPMGIDILRPLNVRAINIKPKIIELRPAQMPDFYDLPAIEDIAI